MIILVSGVLRAIERVPADRLCQILPGQSWWC